ncbi:hypothetical protein SKAU_G00110740 [Synaphobranchus kaupii]|uniref:Uncharacterized protein n=1 Tax=Synaphobranchus kaupii TaxID=118154 RepID=A0A9Q1G1I5_SYNKA|nr:hypothetical protein SKAU_G00110740 [Synaphobranchus kaupii]
MTPQIVIYSGSGIDGPLLLADLHTAQTLLLRRGGMGVRPQNRESCHLQSGPQLTGQLLLSSRTTQAALPDGGSACTAAINHLMMNFRDARWGASTAGPKRRLDPTHGTRPAEVTAYPAQRGVRSPVATAPFLITAETQFTSLAAFRRRFGMILSPRYQRREHHTLKDKSP